MTDHLAIVFPTLAERVRKLSLAELPTPVSSARIEVGGRTLSIDVKRDDQTSSFYGGNKVRKLEYLLQRAVDRQCKCVATFGATASNQALATTLFATRQGLQSICLLSHQTKTPATRRVLGLLLQQEAEIVLYWGDYHARVETMRRHVQNRACSVIPLGGSSWLGTLGYVNAGLEFAAQVAGGEVQRPDRIYMASGTMGSAVGLALGLALAGLKCGVVAVRVSPASLMNEASVRRLLNKTALMMRSIDTSVPEDLAQKALIEIRHEFFGDGYAKSNAATDRAVELAKEQMGLTLETTYTGKAMAALLHDLANGTAGQILFWNTYNSIPLPAVEEAALDFGRLPESFRPYFD